MQDVVYRTRWAPRRRGGGPPRSPRGDEGAAADHRDVRPPRPSRRAARGRVDYRASAELAGVAGDSVDRSRGTAGDTPRHCPPVPVRAAEPAHRRAGAEADDDPVEHSAPGADEAMQPPGGPFPPCGRKGLCSGGAVPAAAVHGVGTRGAAWALSRDPTSRSSQKKKIVVAAGLRPAARRRRRSLRGNLGQTLLQAARSAASQADVLGLLSGVGLWRVGRLSGVGQGWSVVGQASVRVGRSSVRRRSGDGRRLATKQSEYVGLGATSVPRTPVGIPAAVADTAVSALAAFEDSSVTVCSCASVVGWNSEGIVMEW